jgi:hypothetical protein
MIAQHSHQDLIEIFWNKPHFNDLHLSHQYFFMINKMRALKNCMQCHYEEQSDVIIS